MGLMNQLGWSYSAERAWYTPPEYDEPPPPQNDISVKQLIKIMNERNKNAMKLYEISAEYAKFIEAFDNGDIPEEAFADTLDGIHGLFEDKCVAVACSIKNDKVMFDALETEIAQLKKRKKTLERIIESKQQYLLDSMERAGVDKIKNNPRAQLRVSKNPPKIVFADKSAFLRQALAEDRQKYLILQQPTLNESAIKGDLALGVIIPGVYLEQGKRVDIS